MELKHLAPYLPYGLKVKHASKLGNIKKTSELTVSDLPWLRNQKYFKPILEPLSNLTKPITRKGVTFVAIEWFENDVSNDWFDGNIWVDYLFRKEKIDLDFVPYGMVQQLIEWKFDIFDLIGQDKAIAATNEYN
jgi:hypothetical protein